MGRIKRRHTGPKVTRKAKKPLQELVKAAMVCSQLRSSYDDKISPSANLANMGLMAHTNNNIKTRRTVMSAAGAPERDVVSALVGFVKSIPESDVFNPATGNVDVNVRRRPMSQVDQDYFANLIHKHGENYKAMERDIKLNCQQYSETKCRTLCKKLLSLSSSDLLVSL